MAEAAERRWRVEEFLAWDDGTDRRHELVDGRIVAMAPPSEAHAAIVSSSGHPHQLRSFDRHVVRSTFGVRLDGPRR